MWIILAASKSYFSILYCLVLTSYLGNSILSIFRYWQKQTVFGRQGNFLYFKSLMNQYISILVLRLQNKQEMF